MNISNLKPKIKNLKKALFLLIFLIFTFSVLRFNFASAQTGQDQNNNQRIKYLLNITPAIINFVITPGKIQEFEVNVENFLDKPMGIRASLEPFSYPDQKADYLRDAAILKWTEFTPSEFLIEPKSKKSFKVRIKAPLKAAKGGQYAVVFLTPFYSQELNDDTPTILSRVGLLLIGTYGQTDYEELAKSVGIEKFSFPLITDKSGIESSLIVRNGYYNHFSAKPFVSISQILGQRQDFEFEEKNILPKTTREWQNSYNFEPKFPIALYKADLKLSLGEGKKVYKTAYFIYFAYSSYLKYSLILIIFVTLFKFRKRLKKALAAVLTNK